jgi:hypothetical protein
LNPILASIAYVPGLNSSALRWEPNWLLSWIAKTEFSVAWMLALDMLGSKIATFGPKSIGPGVPGVDVGVDVAVDVGVAVRVGVGVAVR